MSIFEFNNYRKYLVQRFEERSVNGFGESKKLAEHLNIHPTYISHILKNLKSFNQEQALSVCKYLNLNPLETEYFLLLVQLDRAGTAELKNYLEEKIKDILKQSASLSNRVVHDVKLSDEQQARFYSDWVYSACRLSTLIENHSNIEDLSNHLGINKNYLKEVTDFLVSAGLIKLQNGKFEIGPLTTHLDAKSPWIKSHHSNWRQKALEQVSQAESANSLHYTAPMTMSLKDFNQVREVLIRCINDIDQILLPSASEELVCLNIDWFRVLKS